MLEMQEAAKFDLSLLALQLGNSSKISGRSSHYYQVYDCCLDLPAIEHTTLLLLVHMPVAWAVLLAVTISERIRLQLASHACMSSFAEHANKGL